eukprot:751338-Hanusia_phi.AAC.1
MPCQEYLVTPTRYAYGMANLGPSPTLWEWLALAQVIKEVWREGLRLGRKKNRKRGEGREKKEEWEDEERKEWEEERKTRMAGNVKRRLNEGGGGSGCGGGGGADGGEEVVRGGDDISATGSADGQGCCRVGDRSVPIQHGVRREELLAASPPPCRSPAARRRCFETSTTGGKTQEGGDLVEFSGRTCLLSSSLLCPAVHLSVLPDCHHPEFALAQADVRLLLAQGSWRRSIDGGQQKTSSLL